MDSLANFFWLWFFWNGVVTITGIVSLCVFMFIDRNDPEVIKRDDIYEHTLKVLAASTLVLLFIHLVLSAIARST